MPNLLINDVNIDFPKDPYPCQVDYMTKVILALNTGRNALLESPTGTGKTLCLLCSCLAWQISKKSDSKLKIPSSSSSSSSSSNGLLSIPGSGNPSTGQSFTIIYASRTHSQLAQVVKELKSTNYAPCVAVLGSREQLCVHDKISKLSRNALKHSCNSLNNKHACSYHNNLTNYQGHIEGIGGASSPIYDIEDLVTMGKRDKVCPYFYSREASEKADIIFLPYNYLIDTSIRSTLKINWNQSIVIFDEAHNIEKIASDAASFSLTSTDIAACIQELQQVLEYLKTTSDIEQRHDLNQDNLQSAFSSKQGFELPTIKDTVRVLKALFEIENIIDHIPLTKGAIGNTTSQVFPGDWLIKAFEASGFTFQMASRNIEEIKRGAEFLLSKAEDVFESLGNSASGHIAEPKLIMLAEALQRVFKGSSIIDALEGAKDYKVFICEDLNEPKTKQSENIAAFVSGSVIFKRVLNYWTFSPGIAMEELSRLGIRSILLTSGTLTPLDSLKEDLKIPFPIELVNPHVINQEDQLWVGAFKSGPTGKLLNSSFSMRGKVEYKDELGLSILQICQTAMGKSERVGIPTGPKLKGGILIFFPTYVTMEDTSNRWKDTGVWEKLRQCASAIVMESQGKNTIYPINKNGSSHKKLSFNISSQKPPDIEEKSVKNNFSFVVSSINKDSNKQLSSIHQEKNEDPNKSIVNDIISEFDSALTQYGNCILLAVCRGKVSEGIDFRDDRGRIVIITGLPFAPYQDPWVLLKRQYLDDICMSNRIFANPVQNSSTSISLPLNLSYGGLRGVSYMNGNNLSTSSNISASQRKPSTIIRRLNGATWYAQTAARAVNQALGRVIRHKKDWGAVFLLDERFLKPQQILQLSGWIRLSVRPHEVMIPAMQDFRNFVTKAISNSSLNFQESIHTDESKSEKRIPPVFKKEPTIKDLFPREIHIPSDTKNHDDCFIDPKLLLSQPCNQIYTKEVQKSDVCSQVDELISTISQNKIQRNSASQSKSTSLADLFQQGKIVKVVNTNPSSTTSSHKHLETTNSIRLRQKIHEKQLNSIVSASTTLIEKNNRFLESCDDIPFDISSVSWSKYVSSKNPFVIETRELNCNSLSSSKKLENILESLKLELSSFSVTNSNSDFQDDIINKIQHMIQSRLEKSSIIKMDKIQEFVDGLVEIVKNILPNLQIEKCLLQFQNFLSEDTREIFKMYMKKVFQNIAKKANRKVFLEEKSIDKDKENHDNYLSQQKVIDAMMKRPRNSIESIVGTSQTDGTSQKMSKLWQPNARIQKSIDLSINQLSQTSVSISNDKFPIKLTSAFSSFSSKIDSIKIQHKTPLMTCAICREVSNSPCAAKCGHICCANCWHRLLEKAKGQGSCPICRASVTNISISRLKS